MSYFSPWKEEAWPGYPTGVPRKGLLGFDTVRMMGPWRNFITNEIKSGRFPSWNPHQFGGAPMSANSQSALFFPLNLIYLILPFHIAWTVLAISQPLLATVGMFLLIKSLSYESLSTHQRPLRGASINALTIIFLSLMYGFSSWMSVWIEWNIHGFVYALLPFALLFIFKQKSVMAFMTTIMIIFSGHPQMAVIAVTALTIASLVWKKFKWFSKILVLSALITAVQWMPTLRYYQQASRDKQSSEFSYAKTLLPWMQLPQLLAPNFFGNPATGNFSGKLDFLESTAYSGIAILGFALLGLISYKFPYIPLKNKPSDSESGLTEKFCLAVLCLIVLLVFPTPVSLLLGKLNIPIFSTSVASRWLMLWPLATILSAAAGIKYISLSCSAGRNFSEKARPFWERPGLYMPAALILIVTLSLWIYAFFLPSEFRSVTIRNLIIPTFIAGLFLLTFSFRLADRQSGMKVFLFTLGFFSIWELVLFGWKTMPYTEKRFIYPVMPVLAKLQELSRGGSRFAATDGSVLESNFATYYGLYDLSGYDALYPRRIGDLVWTAGNNGIPVNDFSRSTVVVPVKQSDARNNLWNLAGVRWIINKDDMLADHPGQKSNDLSSDFKLIWEEGKWQIYENTKAYPRSFFIPDISPAKPSTVLYLAKQDPAPHDPITPITPAEIISYMPNRVEISINAPTDGYLVLTDTYYPEWKASVDGTVANIVPAFGAFRAVPVSSGTHMVQFTYNSL